MSQIIDTLPETNIALETLWSWTIWEGLFSGALWQNRMDEKTRLAACALAAVVILKLLALQKQGPSFFGERAWVIKLDPHFFFGGSNNANVGS